MVIIHQMLELIFICWTLFHLVWSWPGHKCNNFSLLHLYFLYFSFTFIILKLGLGGHTEHQEQYVLNFFSREVFSNNYHILQQHSWPCKIMLYTFSNFIFEVFFSLPIQQYSYCSGYWPPMERLGSWYVLTQLQAHKLTNPRWEQLIPIWPLLCCRELQLEL